MQTGMPYNMYKNLYLSVVSTSSEKDCKFVIINCTFYDKVSILQESLAKIDYDNRCFSFFWH